MGWTVIRAFLWFFLPGGLLFSVGLAFVFASRLTPMVPGITAIAPYAVLAVGGLLGWRFNRSRLVYGVGAFFVADRFLAGFPASSAEVGEPVWIVLNSVATLLPLNLAYIFLLKERGLATIHGLWRLVFITLQPLAVFLLFRSKQDELVAFFSRSFITFSLPEWVPFTEIPVFLFFFVSLLFIGASLKRQGVIDYGFFWALVAGCTALLPWQSPVNATLFFSCAGLILIIAALEEAYKMAFRDELTGLPARRALNEDLLKLGSTYTVAMVDIDFFKKFNDTYGHEVGDQVLRMVAGKLAKVTGGGRAYRYGGEEFTLLFPGAAKEEVLPHLEQLRLVIQTSGFSLRGQGRPKKKPKKTRGGRKASKKVGVTVSIGVSEPTGRQMKPQKVIKSADKALYRAKKRGRNQVAS